MTDVNATTNGNGADKAEQEIGRFASELKQLRSDFSNLSDVLQNLVRRVSQDAAAEASKAGERVYNSAVGATDDLAKAIKEEPLAFTFGAMGIGFILGWLFSGRR
jgi:molecular chaperone GrpE (heat shock protein)